MFEMQSSTKSMGLAVWDAQTIRLPSGAREMLVQVPPMVLSVGPGGCLRVPQEVARAALHQATYRPSGSCRWRAKLAKRIHGQGVGNPDLQIAQEQAIVAQVPDPAARLIARLAEQDAAAVTADDATVRQPFPAGASGVDAHQRRDSSFQIPDKDVLGTVVVSGDEVGGKAAENDPAPIGAHAGLARRPIGGSVPNLVTLTRRFVPGSVSRTKISRQPLVSLATRLSASLTKAT